jgi:hypothetical protein
LSGRVSSDIVSSRRTSYEDPCLDQPDCTTVCSQQGLLVGLCRTAALYIRQQLAGNRKAVTCLHCLAGKCAPPSFSSCQVKPHTTATCRKGEKLQEGVIPQQRAVKQVIQHCNFRICQAHTAS